MLNFFDLGGKKNLKDVWKFIFHKISIEKNWFQ
jgi:hypothetical protein